MRDSRFPIEEGRMVSSSATSVAQYLKELPADRRREIAAVRTIVNASLPAGYVEAMQYGMIGWAVPLSRYPETYNKQPLGYAALAAQKRYNTLYLMAAYADSPTEQMLREAFATAGKKLDMGKCCIRFQRAEDLALDAIAMAVAALPPEEFIASYEAARAGTAAARRTTARKPR
jgi:uncharacterized protein YdhG (YjbR/CyaY superfamily)